MGFDWASESYLADALDSAEDRAERAEAYLAEQESGRANILHTVGSTLAGMGTAGGLAYLSQTAFRKDGKPGMLHVGLPVNVVGGTLFKLAALFGWHEKLGLPSAAHQYVDSIGQGMLDHFAVMYGLELGEPSKDKKDASSHGTKDWEHAKHAYVDGSKDWDRAKHAYVEGNRAWDNARKGYVRGNEPAQVGSTSSSHAPENYMTADQLRVWQSYAG